MVWGWVVLLVTWAMMSSPCLTWISGPGTWPLKAKTRYLRSGATCMVTSSIVMLNSRTSAKACEATDSAARPASQPASLRAYDPTPAASARPEIDVMHELLIWRGRNESGRGPGGGGGRRRGPGGGGGGGGGGGRGAI